MNEDKSEWQRNVLNCCIESYERQAKIYDDEKDKYENQVRAYEYLIDIMLEKLEELNSKTEKKSKPNKDLKKAFKRYQEKKNEKA